MSSQAHRWKLCLLSPAFKWNAQIKNQIKSTRAQTLVRLTVCRWKEPNADLLLLRVFSLTPTHTSEGLHLFTLSFFPPADDSFFLPWAAAVFWALSLGAFCAAADAELEDFEGCVGFEVELEGCRRRRPSSPAEDEWHFLLPPSSPIGGWRHRGQSIQAVRVFGDGQRGQLDAWHTWHYRKDYRIFGL